MGTALGGLYNNSILYLNPSQSQLRTSFNGDGNLTSLLTIEI